ncbi:MAG TPA: aminotransferase class V-fold PLP-dependent enzyme [Steroidobacteraceae bacterium]|jgi:glutamate/tyrosine decarboxylase-like PLP-dependent enzyme|nr:aminotransferase class V-fold PLP-dependent enzyme [Steroidobacteraceae bacterium]
MSEVSERQLLEATARLAASYRESLPERAVRALRTPQELQSALRVPLTESGEPAKQVIEALAELGAVGTTASAGPRYFGFVVGGSTPAALAADWLVSAWDQNGGLHALSPLIAAVEEVTAAWLLEVLRLPASMSVGFVTGCQMASFTALAAARHRVLRRAGWDVEAEGLGGAPPIEILISAEAHYTIHVALRFLGLGDNGLRRLPADAHGRMDTEALGARLEELTGPCIVCAQAGNVNGGAFDPLEEIASLTHARGAWLHVDGAFGLWAAAAPGRAHLVRGIEQADSIAADAHKWLNVPYDCGLVFCADEAAHRGAMGLSAPTVAAPYLATSVRERDPHEFVPEASRRGRAVTVYAALRALGRGGVAELIERNCRQAQRFAAALAAAGHEVLNDVVLNQVVVAFGDADRTRRVVAAVQADGTCWCGGTVWQGRTAMRISVSNWSTSDADVERSLEAIVRIARATP